MDIAASSSKNNTTDVPKLNEDRKRGHEKDCDDDESQAKNLRVKDAANLPPEYDANDSRWTLKYREPAPELVELMDYSGVYVNAHKLAECKTLSNDCLTLARRLLTEIFTSIALSSCSVTDATVGDLDKDENIDCPELDKHAMIILLKFVAEYGLEQNWKITDYECIQNSIQQKLEVMKYLKRNAKDDNVAQEPVKKKLRQKRVVLPTEYDAHDSRWTLKYREPAEGLVELMEHSGVYVNADKLAQYKRLSNNSELLAQLLLTEVFSTSALTTCSVTAVKVENSNRIDTIVRPTLDGNAVTTLMMFLEQYGLEKKWEVGSNERIRDIFHKRITEIRNCERNELLKETRRQERINLAQEYNDSKWTLKYRESAPGLVELMEQTGVYVNVDRLADCKRLSNNCKTMAKLLLVEVFTAKALRTCSIKAVKHKENNQDGENLSPRLDENALTTLLKYLALYGLEMDWIVRGNKWIKNIFCQIMKMMRSPQPNNLARNCFETELIQNSRYLPPGYDDDSRWTLKYREPAPGLVELLEHSGVYVNADKLAECKRLAYDCRSLAQMLFTEIYTSKALLSCSLSDKNRRIFARALELLPNLKRIHLQNKRLRRAELDAHAELVLLNFVDDYALEMGWTVLDFERIRIILFRKLEEIRDDNVLQCDDHLQMAFRKGLRTGP